VPNREPGYLIVRRPDVAASEYEHTEVARRNADLLHDLRRLAPDKRPSAYRGIGRFPLQPFWTDDLEALAANGDDINADREARLRLLAAAEQHEDPDTVDHLLPTEALAVELLGLLDKPGDWEIVRVGREDDGSHAGLLGWDVGWWPECYSLVSDSFVAPTWHGPDPEDFEKLTEQLAALNEFLLFPSPGDAMRFRAWYVTRPWAEHEDEPFVPIRVEAVESHSPNKTGAS
jgi:hypothetical protein